MRLGDLIDLLRSVPPQWGVEFSDGTTPHEFISWRGVYAQLSLDTGDPLTVGELLAKAEAANGGTFTGYKGGDFTMGLGTPVWADPWGSAAGRGIVGAGASAHILTLRVEQIPDEYREMW